MTADRLADLRAEMDALNLRLGDLLQQRARLCITIARYKQAHGIALADPAREQAMLQHVLQHAGPGFDRQELQQILQQVFAASRALALRTGGLA